MPLADRAELRALHLLRDLPDEALDALAKAGVERRFGVDSTLWLRGDSPPQFDFLCDGVVQLRRDSAEGRELVLAHRHAGECLDLIAAVDGRGYLTTALALTDVRLLRFPVEAFVRTLGEQPALANHVNRHLAREGRRLAQMAGDLALHSVRARLARFLLRNAADERRAYRWTQEMIAAQIGSVRDVVGRTLRELLSEGLLRRERGRLVIQDRAALAHAAELEAPVDVWLAREED